MIRSSSPPISARELAVLLLLVVLGGGLRGWSLAAEGIDHYDEGVYVTSAASFAPGAASSVTIYSRQVLFSPPVYFTTVGLALRWLGGAPDAAAIRVNVVLGTLTIAALWWLARSWFGPSAALATAVLVALSPFHIMLSRAALTDVAFALFFVLSLGLLTLAQERDSMPLAIVAGLAVGLTWNAKYHGWFALLVVGAALAPTVFGRGVPRRRAARRIALWGVSAAVAAVCFLPWALYIQGRIDDVGGFARYYLGYLRRDWLGNLLRQADLQLFLEHPLGRLALPAAVGVGWVLRGRTGRSREGIASDVATAAIGLLAGSAAGAALLSLGLLPRLLGELDRLRVRVLLAWVGLWVAAAPLYHPYPRLILPFTLATFVLAGASIAGYGDRPEVPRAGARRAIARPAQRLALLLVGALLLTMRPAAGDPWRRSTGAVEAAAAIAATLPRDVPIVVVGEPSVAHYLRRSGRDATIADSIAPFADLEPPAFLVTGVYAQRALALREELAQLEPRLRWVRDVSFVPSDLRLVDDLRPDDARRYRRQPDATFDLRLDELLPRGDGVPERSERGAP